MIFIYTPYQPHGADLPHPDRNRSFEIAKEHAKAHDLLIIHGAEITRSLPPGHANAIFIEDANKLNVKDSIEAYREAKRQGGFIFWNHPNWIAQQRDGKATLTDLHRMLIREGLLDGIEVVNDITYSDEALQIALDEGLTVMGTSDIHGLVDWQFEIAQGGHRPVTLVFAREKSATAIKEAMQDQRTIAWFNNLLVGHEKVMIPLLESSLVATTASYEGPSSVVTVTLTNNSDADFLLQHRGPFTFHKDADVLRLSAQSSYALQVKTGEQRSQFELEFEVLNANVAPGVHPVVKIPVQVDL